LTDVEGIQNFNALTFLKRSDDNSSWQDVTQAPISATLVHNNPYITIQGLTSFSEFAPGGDFDDPLPVELSAFFAVLTTTNLAQLNWTTQSESNMSGYNIYRNTNENSENAVQINTQFISANNSTETHNYSYTDEGTEIGLTYYYWLEGVENDGTTNFFGPAEITIISDDEEEQVPEVGMIPGIQNIYPNPFNPTTNLSYFIAEDSDVLIEIFNTKGQKVYCFQEGEKEANKIYKIKWEGQTFNGKYAASGTYIFRLSADSMIQTRKAVLMK